MSKMPKDLRSFLEEVKRAYPGDFFTVGREVDLRYEATAIVEKLEAEDRFPVLLFTGVKGHKMPVVTNLAASYARLALAIGSDVGHMVPHYARRAEEALPVKWVDRGEAPVKDVALTANDVDLAKLPIPIHNELDAGQYISGGVAITRDPDTGEINAGIYRHQVQGAAQLGWFINPGNHANYVRLRYEALGRPMDVAIAIGHHPAMLLAAVSKLRGIGGELEVMGGLMGEPVEVVRGETVDLPVPARAEIVIEGQILPGERQDEGPFGEWPRFYTGTGERPFIRVSAITMRRDPIFQDLTAAHAEHSLVGCLPRMGSLYKRIKEVVPSLVNVNLPLSGGGRVYCYISIKKNVDGEPQQAAFAALTTDNSIREVVVVDDDIDVFNERDVLWARATCFQADKDLAIIPYALGSHLNPTAYNYARDGKGALETKLIFDATRPAAPASFPARARAHPHAVAAVGFPGRLA